VRARAQFLETQLELGNRCGGCRSDLVPATARREGKDAKPAEHRHVIHPLELVAYLPRRNEQRNLTKLWFDEFFAVNLLTLI